MLIKCYCSAISHLLNSDVPASAVPGHRNKLYPNDLSCLLSTSTLAFIDGPSKLYAATNSRTRCRPRSETSSGIKLKVSADS